MIGTSILLAWAIVCYCATNLEPSYCCDHCDPCHVHLCFLLCHGVTLVLPSPHAASLVERLRLAITLRNQPLRQCWTTIAVYWKILKVCERLWKYPKISKVITAPQNTRPPWGHVGHFNALNSAQLRTASSQHPATPCDTSTWALLCFAMPCSSSLISSDFIWFLISLISLISHWALGLAALAGLPARVTRSRGVTSSMCLCHSMSFHVWQIMTQSWHADPGMTQVIRVQYIQDLPRLKKRLV